MVSLGLGTMLNGRISLKGYVYTGLDAVVLGFGFISAAVAYFVFKVFNNGSFNGRFAAIVYICVGIFMLSLAFAVSRNIF